MPRTCMSAPAKERIETLFEKLLSDSLNTSVYDTKIFSKIKVKKDTSNDRVRIVVQSKLTDLLWFISSSQLGTGTTKSLYKKQSQLRHDLHLLEELGLLEDNRIRTQGAPLWYFTLRLWHEDVAENLTLFRKFWEQIKSQNFSSSNKKVPVTSVKVLTPSTSTQAIQDWDNAPAIPQFYGRTQELTTLKQWIIEDGCLIIDRGNY